MLKQDLVKEVKLIRKQLYILKEDCKKREDKLMDLLLVLEPFLNALSPSIHKQIIDLINKGE
jgi:hypothetical protein